MKNLIPFFALLILLALSLGCNKEATCELDNTATLIIQNDSDDCTLFIRMNQDFPRGAAAGRADYTISRNSSEEVVLPAGQHELYSLYACSSNSGMITYYGGGEPRVTDLESCEESSVFFTK